MILSKNILLPSLEKGKHLDEFLEFMLQRLAIKEQIQILIKADTIQMKMVSTTDCQTMRETLLFYTLSNAPEVRKKERIAIDAQRAAKKEKTEMIWKQQLLATAHEYTDSLTDIEMLY